MNVVRELCKKGLSMGLALSLLLVLLATSTNLAAADGPPVFINELHYDNDGTDANEGAEIAGPAGTDLTGWQLVPYNGNGGTQYSALSLSGTIPDQQDGFGTLWFGISGLQNGDPDGIALVAPGDVVVQFLSYGGSFAATDGPAMGLTSTDIGVSEPSSPAGDSLQLQGAGVGYDDFTWVGPIINTRGAVNTGQTFLASALSVSKDVTPMDDVDYHGTVTYTVVLDNATAVSDTNALFTDTLPISTTFGSWLEMPAGAVENAGEITWSGTLTNNEAITLSFTAVHNADYDDMIVNAAVYSGSLLLADSATFTVASAANDVTFIYHDLEDVVQAGDSVCVIGTLTGGWTYPGDCVALAADGAMETFSTTISGLVDGAYEYKYVVVSAATPEWDWLNTGNRSTTVTVDATVDDYRNVEADWATLNSPATLETTVDNPTVPVTGQLHINNVTNPAGEGRSLVAELGYGDDADPANWDWFPMVYDADTGNDDIFSGVITPTASGVYSYATRFTGNFGSDGTDNPNMVWVYGDLDGGAFTADQAGVLTVVNYDVEITKTVDPAAVLLRDGNDALVTYTISVDNVSTISDTAAYTVSDALPDGFTYMSDDSGVTPTGSGTVADPLVWAFAGPLGAGNSFTWDVVVSVTNAIADGDYANSASLVVDPVDWDLTNNSATADVAVHHILSIAEARLLPDDAIVAVEGYVNFPSGLLHGATSLRDEFMMQDAALGTAGIDVYYDGGKFSVLTEGEKVLVMGEMDDYNGKREIVVTSASAVYTDGTSITLIPVITDTNMITEPLEGVLVQVEGEVSNAASGSMDIDDGSGSIKLYNDSDVGVSLAEFSDGDYVRVLSVVSQYFTYQIMPRMQSDLVAFPTVSSVMPTDAATDISVYADIMATFNMTVTNVDGTNFTLEDASGAVAGTVSYDAPSMTATFDPDSALAPSTLHTATLTTAVENEAGETMVEDYVWSFTTGVPTLYVDKMATSWVDPDAAFTYTLTVTNETGSTLTGVTVSDTVPVDSEMAYALDGGVLTGDVVSWTLGTLNDMQSMSVRFVVTATGGALDIINNADYYAWATEWVTRETGSAVTTTISNGCAQGYMPIYDIQGSGTDSPEAGNDIETCGVIVGVSDDLNGFFVQDMTGDADAATSDGIFVYRGSTIGVADVAVGDQVNVVGSVSEYYGLTQISSSANLGDVEVVASGLVLPAAAPLNPPADRAAADLYMEAFEGMLTEVPVNVNVVGPTNAYGELFIVRSDTGVTRLVLQTDPSDGYRIGLNDGITDTGEFKVGDVLGGFSGPLNYNYSNWKVEIQAPLTVVDSPALPAWPANSRAAANQFSVGSFNVLNFDGDDPAVKLEKVVADIEAMGAPLFLSISEINTQECWHIDNYTVTSVITELIAGLATEGYNYDYKASHPDVGCHGEAVLYDTDRVTLDSWSTLQDCSVYGSSNATYDPIAATCQTGEFPLFSRRPVVVTGTVSYDGVDTQVVFIGNHFKSKSGSNNEDRRLGQATLVAEFVADLTSGGMDNVIVAGDLNDFIDSPPLDVLYATGALTNTYFELPAAERFSYVYNGMSEVLDHILISDALLNTLESFTPVHINADFPATWELDATPFAVSDHDPVIAYFELPEAPMLPDLSASTKAVMPTGDVAPGDLLTYTVTLSNSGQVDASVMITDMLPSELSVVTGFDGGTALIWSGTVASGAEEVLTLVAQVNAIMANATVSNSVSINDGANAVFEIHSADTAIVLPNMPNLSTSTKVVMPTGNVGANDLLTYTVTLSNTGLVDASVMITDMLPSDLTLVTGFDGATALTWSGTVTAGVEVELTLVAQAPMTVTSDIIVSNTVSINDGVNPVFEIHSLNTTISAGETYEIYLPQMLKVTP